MMERRHQTDEVSQICRLPKRGEGKCKNPHLKLDLFSATKQPPTIHKSKNLWHFMKKVTFAQMIYIGFAPDK